MVPGHFTATVLLLLLVLLLEVASSKRWLRWQQVPTARCLDGSPAGFYEEEIQGDGIDTTSPPTVSFVYFVGGGWCYGLDEASTIKDCQERAKTGLGSSKNYRSEITDLPYLDRLTEGYKLYIVPYCDGTSFSGDRVLEEHGLYFEGFKILNEVFKDVAPKIKKNSKTIVLSGGSAGASTVYYHADYIKSTYFSDSTAARVVAIPDAGYFLNLPTVDGVWLWPTQMKDVMTLSNARKNMHKKCLQRFEPGDNDNSSSWLSCLYPENFSDLIDVDVMMINSMYDTSELYATLDLQCTLQCDTASKYPCCGTRERHAVAELYPQHLATMKTLMQKEKNGHWLVNCLAHTLFGQQYNVEASGFTADAAARAFIEGKKVKILQDPVQDFAVHRDFKCARSWEPNRDVDRFGYYQMFMQHAEEEIEELISQ